MAANAVGTTLEPSLAPELVRYGALDHLASDTLDPWSSRHFDFAFPPLNEKAYRAVDDLLQPPRYGEVTRALRNGTTFCSVRGQLVQHECNELHHGSRQFNPAAVYLGTLGRSVPEGPQLGLDKVAERHRPGAATGEEALHPA